MNREEFGSRVTQAQGRLYRVARGYLRGEQDCLDAVAEAIGKAWEKRAALRQEEYFDTWLIRILIHECLNILRRQKRVQPVETLPESSAPTENEALADALDALPQKLRAATVLHYMEGYPVEDVARMLRVPRGTVCSRLHAARLRLRELLKEESL